MFIVIVILIWAVAMGIWWLCSNAFRHADVDRFKSRLLGSTKPKKPKTQSGPALIHENQGGLLIKLMHRLRLQTRVQELLEQTGLKWTVAKLLNTCLFLSAAGFFAAWLMLPAGLHRFSFVAGLIAGCFPVLYLMRKRKARLFRFEELFPESLEFVARSMRAGHAFSVSLEMIHKEFQEPLAGEFRRTFEEHNLGLPLDVSLQKLAKRVPSLDVHFFVSAVLLQKRTGGNLAEILDKLAYIIRERFKLRGKIRAISAHGRMTGLALTLIPVGVGVLMFYVNPDYVRFFFLDDTGNIMLGAAVALQLIGYGVIRKIVKIEV
ncbi:MAG: type II secretion system F family protein [Bryobacteraceae bacterium]